MSIFRSLAGVATISVGPLLTSPAIAATFTTLLTFAGQQSGEGIKDIRYVDGYLIGTTETGGVTTVSNHSFGNLFKLNLATGSLTILHDFGSSPRDGKYPYNAPTPYFSDLVGVTLGGGVNGTGAIYRVHAATRKESVLYTFGPDNGPTDAYDPSSRLLVAGGVFYGTTEYGGANGQGTIFSLDAASGLEKTIYSFTGQADGAFPAGRLVYNDGCLLGIADGGTGTQGSEASGVVYKLEISTGTLTVLHTFGSNPKDGIQPNDLDLAGDTLYGITQFGGTYNHGLLFSLNLKTGFEKPLYSFVDDARSGAPQAAPVYSNGVLYGTTIAGGASGHGTVYSFDLSSRVETVLHDFTGGADGLQPGRLIMHDGVFYGTTFQGGNTKCFKDGCGTIFSVVP